MAKVASLPVKKGVESKSHLKGIDSYQEMYKHSVRDPEGFWLEAAKNLEWFQFPKKATSGDFGRVNYNWFPQGKLNAAYNCLDRHLEKRAKKSALVWVTQKQNLDDYLINLKRDLTSSTTLWIGGGLKPQVHAELERQKIQSFPTLQALDEHLMNF